MSRNTSTDGLNAPGTTCLLMCLLGYYGDGANSSRGSCKKSPVELVDVLSCGADVSESSTSISQSTSGRRQDGEGDACAKRAICCRLERNDSRESTGRLSGNTARAVKLNHLKFTPDKVK
ncbi:hypothetical protein WMY93_010565 [Mugilogobius chulae]|uniref:Uncharacterized protein n=1 Tax=Mugilogobius chulae TaxID=88201 RepID=A0AAW0PAZ9_9GOBI